MDAHKLTKYVVRGNEDKLSFALQILFLAEIQSDMSEWIFNFKILKDTHDVEILVDYEDIDREHFHEYVSEIFDEILTQKEIDAIWIGEKEDYSEEVNRWIDERKDEHFIQAFTAYMIDGID